MTAEIVELEGCHVLASLIETPDGPCLSRFVHDDLGEACSVVHTLSADVGGYRWIPSVVIAAGMTRRLRRDLARLAKLAEASP